MSARWRERLRGLSEQRPGLRARMAALFAIGSLLLSAFLVAAAYTFSRSSLLNQRDKTGIEQAYRDAQVAQDELFNASATAQSVITRLRALGVQRSLVNVRGNWARSTARFSQTALPESLLAKVQVDRVPARMIATVEGRPTLVIGIPLNVPGGAYFEFIDLSDSNATLNTVRLSLLFGAVITTLVGALLGVVAASRAVRPLSQAALAARAFAGGRLDTRLEVTKDQDLAALATAFNDMAATLQARVERDARFASDVSHELRSPLMTLAASVEVMQARREDLPERAQSALDLLVADVTRFQGLVEDLLEISRFDAGAIRLHQEELLVAEFVRQAVAVSSLPQTLITVDAASELLVINGDRRRLARVIANLIDNARNHGGGEVTVEVYADGEGDPPRPDHVRIAVEDHGPGVPPEERGLIFARFARGAVAGRRSSSDGAGLGLALVDEHLRMHGGRVWVEDRTDGGPGARFVIELPATSLEVAT